MLAQRSVDGIKSCIGTERKKTGIKLINKLKIDYYPTEHLNCNLSNYLFNGYKLFATLWDKIHLICYCTKVICTTIMF